MPKRPNLGCHIVLYHTPSALKRRNQDYKLSHILGNKLERTPAKACIAFEGTHAHLRNRWKPCHRATLVSLLNHWNLFRSIIMSLILCRRSIFLLHVATGFEATTSKVINKLTSINYMIFFTIGNAFRAKHRMQQYLK